MKNYDAGRKVFGRFVVAWSILLVGVLGMADARAEIICVSSDGNDASTSLFAALRRNHPRGHKSAKQSR